MRILFLAAMPTLLWASPVAAQNIGPASEAEPAAEQPATHAELMAARVPVTMSDIIDRPYRIVARVERNVRKATLFSRSPSQRKLEDELWERGRAVGADAVLNARYGGARIIATSWGASRVEGDAVRFLTDAEIAARTPRD